MTVSRLLAIDIGGTTVKYGYWDVFALKLSQKGHFKTPSDWPTMLAQLKAIPDLSAGTIGGVAVSLPGSVDVKTGRVCGKTAVPYLNDFAIRDELQAAFKLPVAIQNDANCAGLAESWLGNAQGDGLTALMIVGTGVGGSMVESGHLVCGADHFAGEFGYMQLNEQGETLSELGSPVKMAEHYSKLTGRGELTDARVVFANAQEGDKFAIQCRDDLIHWLSVGAYNLIVSYNPDRLLIGGGISARDDLLAMLRDEVTQLKKDHGASAITTQIDRCRFQNDANLIGAVRAYMDRF